MQLAKILPSTRTAAIFVTEHDFGRQGLKSSLGLSRIMGNSERLQLVRWKIDVLARRGFERVTGDPLYSYRITDEEFNSLQCLLRETVQDGLKHRHLGGVAACTPSFPALFVCYASEWWRRYYDGTGWTWDPIIEALGASPGGWTPNERGICVENGLREWFLTLRSASGLRYLGSIAFNGGLPMQLLATARSSIGRVLGRTMQLAASSASYAGEIQDWIESLASLLPQSYRQKEIFALLAEVIVVVLRLRDEAELKNPNTAVAQLDERVENWRNRFPMLVEDEHVKGLVEQLLKDAVEAPRSARRQTISLERFLRRSDKDQLELVASLTVPEYMDEAQLRSTFHSDALPRLFELVIARAGAIDTLDARRLAGQEKYRIDRRPVESEGDCAAAEHAILLRLPGAPDLPAQILSADELDPDMPWVFVSSEDKAKFLRQGGGPFSQPELLVSVPAHFRAPVATANSSIEACGQTADRRTLYRLRGTATWEDGTALRFKIVSGRAEATEEEFELSGRRVFNTFLRPSLAFRGAPTFKRVAKDGMSSTVNGVEWRKAGSNRPEPRPTEPGVWEVRYAPGGELRWRTKLVVLQENSCERFSAGEVPSAGVVSFIGWGSPCISAPDTHMEVARRVTNTATEIDVEWKDDLATLPEYMNLTVLWGASDASIRLPFPSRGARIYSADGRALGSHASVPANRLVGVRIIAFLSSAPSCDLEFWKGRGSDRGRIERRIRVFPAQGTARAEIRCIDYLAEIHRLLAEEDALDARVRIDIRIGGQREARLKVGRYDFELLPDQINECAMLHPTVMAQLTPEQLHGIDLEALRLDQVDEEPTPLQPVTSEGTHTGQWNLSDLRSAGPWLIYPRQTSNLLARPLAHTIDGSLEDAYGIRAIMRLTNSAERQQQLSAAVRELVDWANPEWQVVELVASSLGRLPLTTLDLWRVMTKSSPAMASLAMRNMTAMTLPLLERFGRELPFMWELVAFNDWRKAMQSFWHQCKQDLPAEFAEKGCRELLRSRIDSLASVFPSLRVVLTAAAAEVAPGLFDQPELKPGLDGILRAGLLNGDNCALQNLLRAHTEDRDWPTTLAREVEEMASKEGFESFFHFDGPAHRISVINAPVAAALDVLGDMSSDWLCNRENVAKLRKHQAFDPEWFTEAFEVTLLRRLCRGPVPAEA